MLDQLGAAHHLALVVEQVAEQLVFLGGQLHRLAAARDLARARVEPDVARGQLGGGIARGAADQGAQPGDQFLGLERLGDIVVGAGIEAGHLVRPAVARGEHQDRGGLAFLAPAVEHGQPVDLRQAEIEDDRVILLVGAEIEALLAIGGEIHRIARAFQRVAELLPQVRLILDDQQSHVIPLAGP